MGSHSELEIVATVSGERCSKENLRRILSTGCTMSGECRLEVCWTSKIGFDERPKFFLLRCGSRTHLLADEERLVSTVLAFRHLQRLFERIEEESQIDSKSVRQNSAISCWQNKTGYKNFNQSTFLIKLTKTDRRSRSFFLLQKNPIDLHLFLLFATSHNTHTQHTHYMNKK